MSEWIPIGERLPEMLTEVLVSYGRVRKSALVAHYEPYPEDAGDHWAGQCGCQLESCEVTHWMPLPAPPTDAKQAANTQDQRPRTKEAATMSETNERSVASAGSVAERPLGDPEIADEIERLREEAAAMTTAIQKVEYLEAEIARLRLTDEEREAIEVAIRCVDSVRSWKAPQDALREKMIEHAATLRSLLERVGR